MIEETGRNGPEISAPTPDAGAGGAPRQPQEVRGRREKRGGGRPPFVRFLLFFLLALGVLTLVSAGLVVTGYVMSSSRVAGPLMAEIVPEKGMNRERIQTKTAAMEKKISALAPKGLYVVVDTAANRLYIREGARLLREAVVSCGSGNVLPNPSGGKDWVFDTPRGEYKIESKRKNPVWIKPDWAFVEEGKPIPPKNSTERAEEGVLGDYAMGIGRGYFLHGTMYTRMLGRNVTHGCVRIGDDDLKFAYDNLPLGAKVYLY